MQPIYVPSKGRSHSTTTIPMLLDSGLNFYVVVEPGVEYERYLSMFPVERLIILPKSNMGAGYSRQFCKEHSIWKGDDYHWQIDDDITGFMNRLPGQAHRKIAVLDALSQIEEASMRYDNVHQAGMNQNSWPPGFNAIKLNRLPVLAVLNNNKV